MLLNCVFIVVLNVVCVLIFRLFFFSVLMNRLVVCCISISVVVLSGLMKFCVSFIVR